MARKFHPPRRTLRLRCALRRIAPVDNPVRIFQRSHRVKVRLRFPVRNRQILGNGLFRRPHQTHGERHLRVLETKVGWQLQIVFLPKSQCRLHCLHRPVEIVEFDQPLGPQQKLVQQDLRWELAPFSCSGCKPESGRRIARQQNGFLTTVRFPRVAKRDCESKRLVRTATIPRSHRRGAEQGEQSDWPSSAFR